MKRYLVFGYNGYYPEGGWHDFLLDFDVLEDAIMSITAGKFNACKHAGIEWCKEEFNHIVDTETGEIVYGD